VNLSKKKYIFDKNFVHTKMFTTTSMQGDNQKYVLEPYLNVSEKINKIKSFSFVLFGIAIYSA
jgi:hypothetical protein